MSLDYFYFQMITCSVDEVLDSRNQNMKSEWEDVFLAKKETARILGVSNVTLYRWAKRGLLVPILISRKQYYLRADINAFFNKIKGGEGNDFDKAPKSVTSNLKYLTESIERSGNFSLTKLKEALESQFEYNNDGLKLSYILNLGADEESYWIEKIKLVTDSMQTLTNLILQVRNVVDVDKKQAL